MQEEEGGGEAPETRQARIRRSCHRPHGLSYFFFFLLDASLMLLPHLPLPAPVALLLARLLYQRWVQVVAANVVWVVDLLLRLVRAGARNLRIQTRKLSSGSKLEPRDLPH